MYDIFAPFPADGRSSIIAGEDRRIQGRVRRSQDEAHSSHPRDNQLLPNGLRIDDIGEHGSGAILATHNPNIDPELNKYNKDRITQDAGCGGSVDTTLCKESTASPRARSLAFGDR